MTYFIILIVIVFLVVVDRRFSLRKLEKINNDPEYLEQLQKEHNRLSDGRVFYLAVYIVAVIIVCSLTDCKIGFTTEPDNDAISSLYAVGKPVGFDLTETLTKRAEHDTNGWIWGSFFIITGILGLIFKVSIIGARLSINPFGDIQYLINIMCIILGIFLILRVPIYEFFDWPINAGQSYEEFLESFD